MSESIDKKVSLGEMSISIHQLLDMTSKLGASDLHIKSGEFPKFRIGANLVYYQKAVELLNVNHAAQKIPKISREAARELIYSMLNNQRIDVFETEKELDLSVETKESRFRVNVGQERDGFYATMRVIPKKIREISDIGFPNDVWKEIIELQQGLVLVTGVTSSGKSTTLASLIQEINRRQYKKIICIEDPIEYVHTDVRSMVIQRELYKDTLSFYEGVKRSLRQDPDVIFIGEIRDYETVQEALRAAETGHLVFSTLHTGDAAGTVSRIHDLVPVSQQHEIGRLLADYLAYVLSQQLIPYVKGEDRVLAMEVMKNIPRLRTGIIENDKVKIEDCIQQGREFGMISMDNCLFNLFEEEKIKPEYAIKHAKNKEGMRLRIDKYIPSKR